MCKLSGVCIEVGGVCVLRREKGCESCRRVCRGVSIEEGEGVH